MIYLPKFPELKNGYNSFLLSLSLDRNISIIPSNIVETGSIAPGINKVKEVRFNGSSGFKKDSTNTDSSDDLEIVINWIGRFLNIKMAKAYRMLSPTGDPIALVSENVVQTNDLEFFTMCDMKGKLANHVDMINYDGWVDRYFELMRHKAYPDVPESFEYLAQTEEEVNDVIELGYRVIDHIYYDDILKNNAIFDYEKMLFLDTLIGQVDRTVGNYGFIYNSNEDTYLFAPLFDDSTLRKPYTETNVCMINNFIIDRKLAIECLMKKERIIKISKALLKHKKLFIDELIEISDFFLTPEKNDLLLSNIFLGLFYIESILE